jgi:methylated-DNA-[protein]-cysteine S-methyltransferase
LASEQGLAGLWFDDQKHRPAELDGLWPHQPTNPWLQQAQQELEEYFGARRRCFSLPLDLSGGTAFQQTVWQALVKVAYGRTCGYGELAVHLGRPKAARAVGMAVGLNRLSIIVPCHRVLGSRGELTGYAGGLDRKRRLLEIEGLF